MKKITTFETAKIDKMFKRVKYFVSFCVIFFFFISNAFTQTLDEAKKLYSEGRYAEAMPAFEKALSSSPRNTSYNQWYGDCLLETGNPEKAREYLKFAASRRVQEAFRSLGKMHYMLYEFKESAEAYTQYADLLIKAKKQAEAEATRPLIQRSERAARMLSHTENIQIIDSVVINKQNFLEAYLLSSESGYLETNAGQIIYENPLRDKRYFADKNENGKYRLFSEIKLQNNWGDRNMLSLPVDSITNDNYPFVLPDGLTIYYASTGNLSIGGYDLFITRYNMNNDTYLNPRQMGMPFNSIANDYMMAIDEINNIGYFVTDRFQPEDKVIVYTFIPNEAIVPIETDDPKELINRAKITSIQDSWKPGVDYVDYIIQVRSRIFNESLKIARDFSFVINDNIIYHTLNDFENNAARQAFSRSKEIAQNIQSIEDELDKLRQTYARSNNNQKQNIGRDIIQKENALFNLFNQYEQMKKNARNQEIQHLRRQQ